jgi:hypothetical protein
MEMRVPAFFDDVATIEVQDPLARLLGAVEDGRIEYRYVDAVKVAGHSCPTVASSWLMTAKALALLYPDSPPERGNIKVELRAAQDAGAEGVSAMIAGLITGAAGAGGFKGIAGRHGRRNLLEFGAAIRGRMRFTRLDTRRAVEVDYHAERVSVPPDLRASLAEATAEDPSAEARDTFARRWQEHVRDILINHRDDPLLVELKECSTAELT